MFSGNPEKKAETGAIPTYENHFEMSYWCSYCSEKREEHQIKQKNGYDCCRICGHVVDAEDQK